MTEEKKSYYAVIPANVRYDESLPPNAKLLYGEITALCNAEGYCWASNKYFADLYGVSISSIKRWIKALIDKGYITSRLIYKEGSSEIETRWVQICTEGGIKNEPTPSIKNEPDNNTSFNTTFNKKKVSKNGFDEIITAYSCKFEIPVCDEIADLLGEWLKVRKAKRAAMTDRAIQMNVDKLDDLARKSNMTVVEYLKEVICRGWAAFFEIKNYDNKNQTPQTNKNDGWCMPDPKDIDDLSDLF